MYSLSLGTTSSRRKKKKKMQRALKAAQKASEKEDGSGGRMDTGQSFSALKLITDPYELAENLLQRIGRSSEKFSTKVCSKPNNHECVFVFICFVLSFMHNVSSRVNVGFV